MTSTKRKWENVDYDSDGEEPSFGKQILPVANLSVDFNCEPRDGMEYLFTVRRDARRLPHVTRVANPYDVPVSAPILDVVQPNHTSSNLPSESWRSTFLRRFRNLRKNIAQPIIHVHISPDGFRKVMPDKKERDLWWKFLAGLPESDWNPPKKPKKLSSKMKISGHMRAFCSEQEVARDVHDEQIHCDTHETWRINSEGDVELAEDEPANALQSVAQPPQIIPTFPTSTIMTASGMGSPSNNTGPDQSCNPCEITPMLLRKIDHNMSLHLLMYFAYWMNIHLQHPTDPTFVIRESHARWMFALLAKVEDFVSADDMSQLRSLARACLELLYRQRKAGSTGISDESPCMAETSCWMIFTAVCGIWNQSDLWEDAELLLASA